MGAVDGSLHTHQLSPTGRRAHQAAQRAVHDTLTVMYAWAGTERPSLSTPWHVAHQAIALEAIHSRWRDGQPFQELQAETFAGQMQPIILKNSGQKPSRTRGELPPVVLVDLGAVGARDGIVVLHQRHSLRQALQRLRGGGGGVLFAARRQLQLPRRPQVAARHARQQLRGGPGGVVP
jgi:hypothetical protein